MLFDMGVLYQQYNYNDLTCLLLQLFFYNFFIEFRYEDYLLDRYYRTENFDVQAQDILSEFGIFSPTTLEIIQ